MAEPVEKTRLVLAGMSDQATYRETRRSSYWDFTFNTAQGSDFRFVATLYLDDGEVQVRAERFGAPENEYFWYLAYEPVDYQSLEQAHEAALADLQKLLTHESRISHRTGLLFSGFCCEYKEGDTWLQVGGHGYFRFGGFNAPSRRIGNQWRAFPRLVSAGCESV